MEEGDKKPGLNMLERISIISLAERVFQEKDKENIILEEKDLNYLKSLGEEAEEIFYRRINFLEYEKKHKREEREKRLKKQYLFQKRI